jgi:hypothetical protein
MPPEVAFPAPWCDEDGSRIPWHPAAGNAAYACPCTINSGTPSQRRWSVDSGPLCRIIGRSMCPCQREFGP